MRRAFAMVVLLMMIAGSARSQAPWNFNFEWISMTPVDNSADRLFVDENRAYIGGNSPDRFLGFSVLDITDIAHPSFIGSYIRHDLHPFDIALIERVTDMKGSLLFLANPISGYEIIDLAQPSSPVLLASDSTPTFFIRVDGTRMYRLTGSRLEIFDISNPRAPQLLGSILDSAFVLAVRNNLLLTGFDSSTSTNGRFYDVADPAHPRVLQENTGTGFSRILLNDAVAYSDAGSTGIDLHTMSSPFGTRRIGRLSFPDDAASMSIFGGLLFVGSSWGIEAIDASVPFKGNFLKGAYDTPSRVQDIRVRDRLAYIADEGNGLLILRYTGPLAPPLFDDARVVSHESPVVLTPGTNGEARIVMKNLGQTTWAGRLGYKLAVINDTGGLVNTTFPRIGVPFNAEIASGEEYAFVVPLKAPLQSGSYHVVLQMVHEFDHFFGETLDVRIDVAAARELDPSKNAARVWLLYD
jgi:hypothetical protein